MAKHTDLREFQQNLIDRLQAAGTSEERVTTMGIQIAGRNCLVDMEDISEVLPVPILEAVPFARHWFRGMANVRGNLYGVVDLAAYEGSGITKDDVSNRILLVANRYSFNVALLVDRVLGLRDARQWRQVDGVETEFQDEQGATWKKLDVSGLLKQAEFLQISS